MICFTSPQYEQANTMWFIAHCSANYKTQLAKHSAHFKFLYHGTSLASARDLSPLALKIDSSKMLDAICTELQNNLLQGGLFTFVGQPTHSQALAHLRARMFVTTAEYQRAVLHYYNPKVLEVLLRDSNDGDSQHWMTGLLSISWLSRYTESENMWCTVFKRTRQSIAEVPKTPWQLTPSQLAALHTLED